MNRYPKAVEDCFFNPQWLWANQAVEYQSPLISDASNRQQLRWYRGEHLYYRIQGSVWATACCETIAQHHNHQGSLPCVETVIERLAIPSIDQHHAHWTLSSCQRLIDQSH